MVNFLMGERGDEKPGSLAAIRTLKHSANNVVLLFVCEWNGGGRWEN